MHAHWQWLCLRTGEVHQQAISHHPLLSSGMHDVVRMLSKEQGPRAVGVGLEVSGVQVGHQAVTC